MWEWDHLACGGRFFLEQIGAVLGRKLEVLLALLVIFVSEDQGFQ